MAVREVPTATPIDTAMALDAGARGVLMPAGDVADLCVVHTVCDALQITAAKSAADRLGAWALRRLQLMRQGGHAAGCQCHLCDDSRIVLTTLGVNMDLPQLSGQPERHGFKRRPGSLAK